MTLASAVSTARTPLARRELFLWLLGALCVGGLLQSVQFAFEHALAAGPSQIQGFAALAWVSAFACLAQSRAQTPASRLDAVLALSLAVIGCAPSDMLWVAATAAALFIGVRAASPWERAAAQVLAALAVQRLWGRLFFAVAAPLLIRMDSIFTGWTFPAALYGVVRHGNVLSLGHGHGVEIVAACSSFNNISLAMLCWVAVTKLQRPDWRRWDAAVGAAAILCVFAANLARLHMMVLSEPAYLYWHYGPGQSIFATGVSCAVLGVTILGSTLVSRLR